MAQPPRSQSIESNHTPSCRKRDCTPPYHRDCLRGQADQPPTNTPTHRSQRPPVPTFPVAEQLVQVVLLPGISKKILKFCNQLSDTKLNQARRDNPQVTHLARDEITLRLALTDMQLNTYYAIPVTPEGAFSGAMEDFISSLPLEVADLFLP